MENMILILLAFVLFFDALFDKWTWWHKLETFGENQKVGLWLYNLTHCRFCCLFWMTVIIWIWCVIAGVLDWTTFPVVFVVSGLTTLKHRL